MYIEDVRKNNIMRVSKKMRHRRTWVVPGTKRGESPDQGKEFSAIKRTRIPLPAEIHRA